MNSKFYYEDKENIKRVKYEKATAKRPVVGDTASQSNCHLKRGCRTVFLLFGFRRRRISSHLAGCLKETGTSLATARDSALILVPLQPAHNSERSFCVAQVHFPLVWVSFLFFLWGFALLFATLHWGYLSIKILFAIG